MYPHLLYMLALRRFLQYELASRLRISESRFSRCLSGRQQFTDEEKRRIAEALGCPDPAWLFAQPVPPRAVHAGGLPILAAQS